MTPWTGGPRGGDPTPWPERWPNPWPDPEPIIHRGEPVGVLEPSAADALVRPAVRSLCGLVVQGAMLGGMALAVCVFQPWPPSAEMFSALLLWVGYLVLTHLLRGLPIWSPFYRHLPTRSLWILPLTTLWAFGLARLAWRLVTAAIGWAPTGGWSVPIGLAVLALAGAVAFRTGRLVADLVARLWTLRPVYGAHGVVRGVGRPEGRARVLERTYRAAPDLGAWALSEILRLGGEKTNLPVSRDFAVELLVHSDPVLREAGLLLLGRTAVATAP